MLYMQKTLCDFYYLKGVSNFFLTCSQMYTQVGLMSGVYLKLNAIHSIFHRYHDGVHVNLSAYVKTKSKLLVMLKVSCERPYTSTLTTLLYSVK